jgi:hypothetical protein
LKERRHYSPEQPRGPQLAGSPELDLLLTCVCWPQRRLEDRQLIQRKLSAQLDWPLFLRLVQHHRLVPLVFRNLSAGGPDSPSAELRKATDELRRLSISSARESLGSLGELRRLIQKLQAKDIPVRVLKGLPLAQSVFGDLSLRAPGDIDLLIDETSIVETDKALRSFGYHGTFQVGRFSAKRLSFYRSHWKDLVYQNPATGFEVDLHWRCFRNSAMPGVALCAATGHETVCFGGFPVETLPRLESLLYLCVHGTLDGWLYLKSLVDVGAQVRTMSSVELDQLATLAQTYGVLPELTATLILVRRYLALDRWSSGLLPESDRTVEHTLRYADYVLVHSRFLAERASIPISRTIAFEFGLRRNFRYRFELLLRVLFRARMWETIPLPDFLFGIYPLLSPFEWAIHRLRQSGDKPAPSRTFTL